MPNRLSLARMAEFVRHRRLSPVELVNAHLRQIERCRPALNPFIEVYEEEARRAAREAESAMMRRELVGPLHGVPVTIKDSFDIAGRATACGSMLRVNEIAERDALCVERLKRAGAIVMGKTSCPEFLMNYETDNYLIGRTNNPWDEERTAGGSSGGEAAAIASFCSAGGMGSDGGGSIREPAHFCGIAGLKPTPGRVPAVGHIPPIAHPGGLMGVAGPMARNAEDLRIIYEAVEGFDARDPFSVRVEPDVELPMPVPVAVMEQYGEMPAQPEMSGAVARAASLLEQTGVPLVDFEQELVAGAHELWRFLFINVNAPLIREAIGGREGECHRTGLELIDLVKDEREPTASELCVALANRDAMRARLLEWMAEAPVILAPACGVAAFRHGERAFPTPQGDISMLDAMAPLTFVNLLGLPSVTVPVTLTAEGLPVGVQLIGAPWSEDLLLELAIRFERARGPFAAPRGYDR